MTGTSDNNEVNVQKEQKQQRNDVLPVIALTVALVNEVKMQNNSLKKS
jgi:hypothetical protein